MSSLAGKVAIVTGASRGIGKGIALGLGEAGATVYVTGRSTRLRPGTLPGTVDETAEEITHLGGKGVAAPCDHRSDAEVEALFVRVQREQGRLDLLVNNAFASPEQRTLWSGQPFWEVSVELWDSILDVGLRAAFVAAGLAARVMLEQRSGVLMNVASHAAVRPRTEKSRVIMPYSVSKAAIYRMTHDMAVDLRRYDVAVISVWPPATKTEGVLAQPEVFGDLSEWQDPIFSGRVVAALVARGGLMARTGESLVLTELAAELGMSAKVGASPA